MIYDQSQVPGGFVTFKQILDRYSQRVHLADSFRQRIVTVPLGLDHPYWADDPDFDLEYHVRHVALPSPKDWRQLCILVARIHSRPLDLTRPLWEFTVIEGLDNVEGIPKGSFAVASKVHHAAIDGVSGSELATAIHDLEPEPPITDVPDWDPAPLPTQTEMLARAGVNNLRQPLRLSRLLAEAAPAVRAARGDGEVKMPIAPGDIPRTRFNTTVSAHRVFEARSFNLERAKAIKNAVPGATLNDVILTICGGAIRRYLEHHDEVPESTLVAMAPVSTRDAEAGGNQITNMSVALHSDIDDCAERLEAVSQSSRAAKKLTEKVGPRLLAEAAQSFSSLSMAMAGRIYGHLGDRLNPPFNCVITNVPGPQFPIFSAGAELVTFFGYGPLVDGLGLFMPIFSYNGLITISVTSCREMMPDPQLFAEGLNTEFEELYAAVVPKSKGKGKRSAKKAAPSNSKPGKKEPGKKKPGKKKVAKKSAAKKSAAKKKGTKKLAKKNPAKSKMAKKQTAKKVVKKKTGRARP